MSVSDWVSLGGAKEKETQSTWWGYSFGNGAQQREEQHFIPALSYTQRFTLFAVFLTFGLLCFLGASVSLLHVRAFAKFYTLGSMFVMSSSFFLVGPATQLRNLLQPSRLLAFLMYVAAMVATLYSALYLQRMGLTIVCVVLQLVAALWYGLAWVPFAQTMVLSTVKTCCGPLLPV